MPLFNFTSFLPAWDSEVDDRLVCRAILPETHDIKTFLFAAPEPRLFRHVPGQFLTFTFEIDGSLMQRCYTIARPPTRPNLLGITVKRIPGGPVSNWLHDRLQPGDTVRAIGPLGDFSSWLQPQRKWLYLSGGVGITPLMAMTRAAADLGGDPDTLFVHAARTPGDIVFRAELEVIARQQANFRLAYLVERVAGEPGWSGYRGRISRALLEQLVPDLAERSVLCCGPAPFMAAVRTILAEIGFDMANYREESFTFAAPLGVAELPATNTAPAPTRSFTIRFTKSDRSITCNAETTILEAARIAGLRFPSSCTKGLCGTCKTKKLDGEVDMRHQGGIRQREIDQGMVLLCCSRPLADCSFER